MRRRTGTTAPQPRLGFTLIELLVVIVILALLIGLLTPAVMKAMATAQDGACAAEINSLSQALADFKTKHNCYPPSRILIVENGDYGSGNLGTNTKPALLAPRSLTYLRKIWPRLQFNTSATKGDAPGVDSSTTGIAAGKFYDVNGNGTLDAPYILEGHQCLVLFLGGIPQANGAGYAMTGFSKNPANPFQTTVLTTNRTVPYFEFNNSRLVGAGFPGYIDYFGASSDPGAAPYYVYFSSYEGVGYDPDDVNGSTESDTAGSVTAPILGAFTAPNAATPNTVSGKIVTSAYPNPYTNDTPIPTAADGSLGTRATMPAWQNGQTFQIISSGRDRLFGIGGQYLAKGNERVPFVSTYTGYSANSLQTMSANNGVTKQSLGPDARSVEKDNITNFSGGRLD